MLRVGIAVLHVTTGLISTSVFGAELPFDKVDEFPAGAYDFIADKRIVWLGEVHGTNEAPELLLGLVKLVTKHHGEAPVVALEIPASHQAAIDGYMASGDESFLRTCAFFTSANKDGTGSPPW